MFSFSPQKPNLKFFPIEVSNNQLSLKLFGVNSSKSWFRDHCGDLITKYKVQKLPTTTLNKHFDEKFIDVPIMELRLSTVQKEDFLNSISLECYSYLSSPACPMVTSLIPTDKHDQFSHILGSLIKFILAYI